MLNTQSRGLDTADDSIDRARRICKDVLEERRQKEISRSGLPPGMKYEMSKRKVKREGCFIATACYGSYDAPEIVVLRRYRDEVLRNSTVGRYAIRCYYSTSPFIAAYLVRSSLAAHVVKLGLINPLLRLVKRKMRAV